MGMKRFIIIFLQCTWGILQTFLGLILFLLREGEGEDRGDLDETVILLGLLLLLG